MCQYGQVLFAPRKGIKQRNYYFVTKLGTHPNLAQNVMQTTCQELLVIMLVFVPMPVHILIEINPHCKQAQIMILFPGDGFTKSSFQRTSLSKRRLFFFLWEGHLKFYFHKASFNAAFERSSLKPKEGSCSLLLLRKWVKTSDFSCRMSNTRQIGLSRVPTHIFLNFNVKNG